MVGQIARADRATQNGHWEKGGLGQSVTFTATLTAQGSPAPSAGLGSVVLFYDGTTLLGQGFVTGSTTAASATFTTSTLGLGSHAITAAYPGSGQTLGSTSPTLTQVVNAGPLPATTTTLSSSQNPSIYGQSVTLTATVSGTGGTPTGTVTFYQGADVFGTAPLVNGQATINCDFGANKPCNVTGSNWTVAGQYPLTASYGGDPSFQGSVSATLIQTINRNPTTTTVGSSPNPSALGQSVTFTATLTAQGSPAPSAGLGSVVLFYDGTTLLGQGFVTGSTTAASATFTTSTLGLGSHAITAAYPGSGQTLGSTSPTLTQVVNASNVTVTTASLPGATFGSSYTAPALTASGGTSPYTFTASGLPNGLTLTNGVISGAPTQAGTFTVGVIATDSTTAANGGPFASASKSLSLVVAAPTITVTTTSLPGATFGSSYTAPALTASGGTSPHTFAATGLPNGLTLTNGVISGTPTQAGTFTVGVIATDSTTAANGGPFASASKSLSLVVAAPTITVTTTSLPGATFGSSYTAPALTASGGTSPYTFTASGLPNGLTLTNGVISGTPTQAGTFTVGVIATDSTTAANGGPFASASKSLSLVVAAPTITVTTTSLPGATFGSSYTAPALTASGGTSPHTFTATGLPGGLTLTNGVISGTPTQSGTFTVGITATDSTTAANGGPFASASKSLSLVVAAPTITVTTTSLPGATFGSSYTAPALTASGGTSPHIFTATGLPNGLMLTNGVISGTPTQAGTFTVGITATDSTTGPNGGPFSSASKSLTLMVNQAPQTIVFTKPADQTFASNATVALAATGGASGNPIVFTSNSQSVCTVSGTTATIVATGTCSITANQAGSANYAAATPVTQTFKVNQAATTTLISSSTNSSLLGQPVTFTATVAPAAALGSVTFKDGATALCSNVPLTSGIAICTRLFCNLGRPLHHRRLQWEHELFRLDLASIHRDRDRPAPQDSRGNRSILKPAYRHDYLQWTRQQSSNRPAYGGWCWKPMDLGGDECGRAVEQHAGLDSSARRWSRCWRFCAHAVRSARPPNRRITRRQSVPDPARPQ